MKELTLLLENTPYTELFQSWPLSKSVQISVKPCTSSFIMYDTCVYDIHNIFMIMTLMSYYNFFFFNQCRSVKIWNQILATVSLQVFKDYLRIRPIFLSGTLWPALSFSLWAQSQVKTLHVLSFFRGNFYMVANVDLKNVPNIHRKVMLLMQRCP